ncbi:MAG TPA: alcohol dehydrogenase catalytic domain-containing protein [Streptosporangiaceae bacterium]
MRAFIITGPGEAEVGDVPEPTAGPGQVVVQVERAGVCGTDLEIFSGHMSYLETGEASYPIRIGHEWSGVVTSAGEGVDRSWLGRWVAGDTMLGCGHCERCQRDRHYLCADRYEIGIRRGWPGALAEYLLVPARALIALPDGIDAMTGALVEPGGNALRAVDGANLTTGDRLLIIGPGTIGLLAALFARAQGNEVHLVGTEPDTLDFAATLGFDHCWTAADLPNLRFDAVIDASNSADVPAQAAQLVEPGGRLVLIGLSTVPSPLDTRVLALKDVTAVGVLGGSKGLHRAAELYATGIVDPRPLVAATLPLDQAPTALSGTRNPTWAPGPKIHINPRPQ